MILKNSHNNNGQLFKFTGPFRFSSTNQSMRGVLDYGDTELISALVYSNTFEYKGSNYGSAKTSQATQPSAEDTQE